MNKSIWYSGGYKTVASVDDLTKPALDGVNWDTTDGENYMRVKLTDDQTQTLDGQNINVMLTPVLA